MKSVTLQLSEDVYERLERAARENGLRPEDLLRVQVERFVSSYHGPNPDAEIRKHVRATIEEYRGVLKRLAE